MTSAIPDNVTIWHSPTEGDVWFSENTIRILGKLGHGSRVLCSDFDGTISTPNAKDLAKNWGIVDKDSRPLQYLLEPAASAVGYYLADPVSEQIRPYLKNPDHPEEGVREGTPMSADLLHKCGRLMGDVLLENNLIYVDAFRFFHHIIQRGAQIVVLTAGSSELIGGIMERVSERFGIPVEDCASGYCIEVAGQSHTFNPDGSIHHAISFRRNSKIAFVQAAEEQGAVVAMGAGDSLNPKDNDAFVRKGEFGIEMDQGKGWRIMMDTLELAGLVPPPEHQLQPQAADKIFSR